MSEIIVPDNDRSIGTSVKMISKDVYGTDGSKILALQQVVSLDTSLKVESHEKSTKYNSINSSVTV
jgi:hypothetical protein